MAGQMRSVASRQVIPYAHWPKDYQTCIKLAREKKCAGFVMAGI
ncbi:Uncharacterised protein [Serratia ficaria]|uniref:Uncharacterized protein n=1 Tax=Serratia ficaria TaxID=61651 RepID=A0A240BW34_SERFI|nr:hypothetical protein C7332_3471 [Serratia ficaria]CAI0719147.1 Uncharacterised protein [Serratia ficaria]CAI0820663.1 Uncharacterised protein [Serratia ficaria]CAI0914926.1 Uncharacterised protein [Serratia ficaria]CAI0917566.1 Uncharacterised protein [Serratia ficaria]